MKYEEIYDKLPASWEEVSLKTAIAYLNVNFELPPDDEIENIEIGLNNIFKTIVVLTGASIEDVKEIPMHWVDKMAAKTAFLNVQPEPVNTSNIKWKELDEVTYDNFITFTQLHEDFVNGWPTIIKSFSKNKLTKEEILQLNMVEVHTAFFFAKEAIGEINATYENIFSKAADEARQQNDTEEANTLQAEIKKDSIRLHKIFGWHFFAKRLSEYLNMNLPAIMEMPAMDVFGYYMVMDADIKTNGNKINNNGNF